VTFTDLDLTDSHTTSFAVQAAGYLGAFSLDALAPDSTGGVTGSVGWHFSVADGALDFLAAGQTLTQKYDVTVADGHGGTATQTVTVTINGTDDAPVGVDDSGSATEAGGTNNGTPGSNATGNVLTNDTDVDNTNAS